VELSSPFFSVFILQAAAAADVAASLSGTRRTKE
jgi:hypothetical protein